MSVSLICSFDRQLSYICFLVFRLNALVNFPSNSLFSFLGDPHQFEQKFNYRRPMYPILKYMWAKDDYRESVKVKNPL